MTTITATIDIDPVWDFFGEVDCPSTCAGLFDAEVEHFAEHMAANY
jgi:hypothetical protein